MANIIWHLSVKTELVSFGFYIIDAQTQYTCKFWFTLEWELAKSRKSLVLLYEFEHLQSCLITSGMENANFELQWLCMIVVAVIVFYKHLILFLELGPKVQLYPDPVLLREEHWGILKRHVLFKSTSWSTDLIWAKWALALALRIIDWRYLLAIF